MIGSEVRAARESLGLDRRAFSRALGCEQSACGKWERGQRPVTPANAANIARLLAGEAPLRSARAQAPGARSNGPDHAAGIAAHGTAPRRAHRRTRARSVADEDEIEPVEISDRTVAWIATGFLAGVAALAIWLRRGAAAGAILGTIALSAQAAAAPPSPWVLLGISGFMGSYFPRDTAHDADMTRPEPGSLPTYRTKAACEAALHYAIQKYAGRTHLDGNYGSYLCSDLKTWTNSPASNAEK